MKYIYRFIGLLFILSLSFPGLSNEIEGPRSVCIGLCYTYEFVGGDSIVILEWTLTSGSENYNFAGDSPNEAEICFPEDNFGPFELFAEDSTGNTYGPFSVFVGEFTEVNLEIVSPINCKDQKPNPQSCFRVCENELVTFQMQSISPEEIQWSFSGSGEIVYETLNSITIMMGEGGGSGFLTYFGETAEGCIFEGGDCIEIVEKPKASFTSFPEAVGDTISICRNQSVIFTNTSTSNNIQWFSDNGSSSEGNNFTTEFSESGYFLVSQLVSETCSCEDLKSVVVHVLEEPGPSIYCSSSVCQGDTAIYRTDPACEPYFWEIEGSGIIISGGTESDDHLEVIWEGGTQGTVSLASGCHDSCPFPTTEIINILGEETTISGPVNICAGENYSYSVPTFDGTSYLWSVGPGGSIIGKRGKNSINVKFSSFSTDPFVAIRMENCTRDCEETDTLWLNLTQPIQLNGPATLCPGETGQWNAVSNGNEVPGSWQILDANGTVVYEEAGPSSSVEFSTTQSGIYTVIGTPENDDFCQAMAELQFEVYTVPNLNPGIEGPLSVCPNQFYTYTVDMASGNGIYFEWMVINGSDTSEFSGEKIRVNWMENVEKFILLSTVDALTGCRGSTTSVTVEDVDQIEWTGAKSVCRFATEIYSLNIGHSNNIEWSISDPDLVSILNFPSDSSVRLKWENPGTFTLEASTCGLHYSNEITILPEIEPVVVHPDELCVSASATVFTEENYSNYYWYENGVLICTSDSCDLGPGNYLLQVEDSLGCSGEIRFSIDGISPPDLSILNIDPAGFCLGDSVRIVANLFNIPGYEFTWYFEGNPLPDDSDTLIAHEEGDYYLVATNPLLNCAAQSNTIELCEFCHPFLVLSECPSGGGGGGNPNACDPRDGRISADYERLSNCNEFRFWVENSNILDESLVWTFFDGDNFIELQGNPVEYTFTNIGVGGHFIVVDGFGVNTDGDSVRFLRDQFTIYNDVAIDFSSTLACRNNEVQFTALPKLGVGISITEYSWNFDDPSSGASDSSAIPNPTHSFSNVGVYDVSLLVTTNSGCNAVVEKPIVVKDLPDSSFTTNEPICLSDAIEVEANSDNAFYSWFFDFENHPDELHDRNNPAAHKYEEAGSYTIRLYVENLQGCTNETMQVVDVFQFEDSLQILSDKTFPLCEGDWATLSVGSGYSTYQWSNDSTSPDVLVEESAGYSVTVTDHNGCSASVGPFEVNYEPAPEAIIAGRIVGETSLITGDTLTACFGSSIALLAIGNGEDRNYLWNDGYTTREITFDNTELDFLPVGLHEFVVEVENSLSGCRKNSRPFFVRIHPTPDPPILDTDPSEPLCSEEDHRIFITNSLSSLDYNWNTGEIGEEINTELAGTYFAVATNEHGCQAQSATVVINPLPDISFAPRGCFEACDAAIICLPLPDGYELISWEKDGEDLSIPPNPDEIIISETGTYVAEIQNEIGCTNRTEPIEFEISDNNAGINGLVFLDLDGDSLFTFGVDSVLQNVKIELNESGNLIDSAYTDANGEYEFPGLDFGTYEVIVRAENFPSDWVLIRGSSEVSLESCGQEVVADPLLLLRCQGSEETFEYSACAGESVEINGQIYESDTTFTIEVGGAICPELETHEITFFSAPDTVQTNFSACAGESVDWGGQTWTADTVLTTVFQDNNGCDSVVITEFSFQPPEEEFVQLYICPGEEEVFQGHVISGDTTLSFLGDSPDGDCPLLYSVEAEVRSPWTVSVQTQNSCPGVDDGLAILEWNGIQIAEIEEIFQNGNAIGVSPTLEGLSAGSYQLELVDIYGCRAFEDFEIGSEEELLATLPDVELSCEESGGILDIQILSGDDGNLTFDWETGQSQAEIFVEEAGEYRVQVSNDCQTIELTGNAFFADSELEDYARVYIPNVFSPNNDEVNDLFMPLFPPDRIIGSYYFAVYDRWGNRVFQAREPYVGWEGDFDKTQTDMAVFAWRLEVEFLHCGRSIWLRDYGDVTTMR